MRRKLKSKIWIDNRAKRILREMSRSKRSIYDRSVLKTHHRVRARSPKRHKHSRQKPNPYIATAPSVLNLSSNPDETIKYFNSIYYELSKPCFGRDFIFNLDGVTDISYDAIVYMLAIIKNGKANALKVHFSGTFPKDKGCKDKLYDCGFMCYMQSVQPSISVSEDNFRIISGSSSDPLAAQKICDFIQSRSGAGKSATSDIYKTIIELTTNTKQHAYGAKKNALSFSRSWYIFAEDSEHSIQIFFLDTGEGISKTIRRKIKDIFLLNDKESNLILSALKGELRTETNTKYRGKGLRMIYDFCINGSFKKMQLISDKGCCIIDKEGTTVSDFKDRIYGTFFNIQISKEAIRGVKNEH